MRQLFFADATTSSKLFCADATVYLELLDALWAFDESGCGGIEANQVAPKRARPNNPIAHHIGALCRLTTDIGAPNQQRVIIQRLVSIT